MYVRSARSANVEGGFPTARPGSVHVCQVPGCAAAISRRHLMCAPHWFEVPMPTRTEVFRSLAAWLNGDDNVRPYLIARLDAIIAVATKHHIGIAVEEARRARLVEELLQQGKGQS